MKEELLEQRACCIGENGSSTQGNGLVLAKSKGSLFIEIVQEGLQPYSDKRLDRLVRACGISIEIPFSPLSGVHGLPLHTYMVPNSKSQGTNQ